MVVDLSIDAWCPGGAVLGGPVLALPPAPDIVSEPPSGVPDIQSCQRPPGVIYNR